MAASDSDNFLLKSAQYCTAVGVVFGALYWASGLIITLLVSIFLVFMCGPFVTRLERFKVPRAIPALGIVLVLFPILLFICYGTTVRLGDAVADWPAYRSRLKEIEAHLEKMETGVDEIWTRSTDAD